MASATRSVGTVRKGISEKVARKLRNILDSEKKNIPDRRNSRKELGALGRTERWVTW